MKEKKAKAKKNNADRITSDENVLAMYLREISRIPLLSRDEEDTAARAAAKGSLEARNRLINGNLRFVVNVAKRYQGQGIPLADLINEGNLGLINAAERFDAERGYRFISYAVWWIRQAILRALCEKSRLIRLPANRVRDLLQIKKAEKMLSGSNADADIQEIAQMLDMDEGNVEDLMTISREMVSLEKTTGSCMGTSQSGCYVVDARYDTPDQEVIQKSLETDIEGILDTLDSKEAEIIRHRYGLGKRKPMSLVEIGNHMGLTKERIRQIEQKAMKRLQNPGRKDILEAYVA